MDVLLEVRNQLERARDDAARELEDAKNAADRALAERTKAAAEFTAAKEREETARIQVNRARTALAALDGEKRLSFSEKIPDVQLVEIAETILSESIGGRDEPGLKEVVYTRIGAESKRGLHRTFARLLTALREDPRFSFDGRVWRFNPKARSIADAVSAVVRGNPEEPHKNDRD